MRCGMAAGPLRAGWQAEQIGRAGVSDGSVESAIRRPGVQERPVELVRRIVGGDPHALDLLDLAVQTPNGVHHAFDNVQSTAPTGNTQAKAVAAAA